MTLLWLWAFTWTLAIEQPIYIVALRRHVRRWWTPGLVTLAVNTITHPLLWFAFPRLDPYWQYVMIGEVCVVVVEAAIVAVVIRNVRVAVLASVVANVTSTLLGLLLLSAGRA